MKEWIKQNRITLLFAASAATAVILIQQFNPDARMLEIIPINPLVYYTFFAGMFGKLFDITIGTRQGKTKTR